MGPILIVDKSTIQGLSFEEVRFLNKHYMLVATPILIEEILSGIAKADGGPDELRKKTSYLAQKINGLGSQLVPSAKSILLADLMHNQIPLDGRIPMFGGERIRNSDGSIGVIFDEPPERAVIRNWERGDFSELDQSLAKQIRERNTRIDLVSHRETLKRMATYKKEKSLDTVIATIDTAPTSNAKEWMKVASLAGMFGIGGEYLRKIHDRWVRTKVKNLSSFSPYAAYLWRLNAAYTLGLVSEIVPASKSDKSFLDLQYLYYLPFGFAFTSSDKFLAKFTPYFLRANQVFIDGVMLKADLKEIATHWNGLSDEDKTKYERDRGSYPPPIASSITHQVWTKTMRPWSAGSGNRAVDISEDESRRTAREIHDRFLSGIRNEGGSAIDPDRTKKLVSLDLCKRGAIVAGICMDVLEFGKRDWSEIKKEISASQVKEIYSHYAELWRPDTAILDLLPKRDSLTRAFYIGDFSPPKIFEDVTNACFFFDEVFIDDPFQNPWNMKQDYNPISNPDLFIEDTLKISFVLICLFPWIEAGFVKILPDPYSFDLKAFRNLVAMAKKRSRNIDLTMINKLTIENGKELTKRMLARMPRPNLIANLKLASPDAALEELEESANSFEKMRREDPTILDRPFGGKSECLTITRSGGNLESVETTCRLIGATPYFGIPERFLELLQSIPSKGDCGAIDLKFPSIIPDDLALLFKLRKSGFGVCTRKLIAKLGEGFLADKKAGNAQARVESVFENLQCEIDESQEEWRLLQKSEQSLRFVPESISLTGPTDGLGLPGISDFMKKTYHGRTILPVPPFVIGSY